jgi:hypothetical protein
MPKRQAKNKNTSETHTSGSDRSSSRSRCSTPVILPKFAVSEALKEQLALERGIRISKRNLEAQIAENRILSGRVYSRINSPLSTTPQNTSSRRSQIPISTRPSLMSIPPFAGAAAAASSNRLTTTTSTISAGTSTLTQTARL